MKIRFFVAYVVVSLPFANAWALDVVPYYRFNLQQCIAMALRNNEEIKAADYDVQIVRAKRIEATKRYVPVIKYTHRMAPVPRDLDNPGTSFFQGDISVFNSFRVEAGVPVYWFGRISTARVLADMGIELSGLQKQKKSDEVILNVYKLYNGILLARELKGLAHQALDAIEKKIIELEKEENTDQLAILKLKVVLYEVERRLDEAATKEEVALATIKVLMGIEDDVDFDIKDVNLKRETFPLRSYEHYLAQSKGYLPEYRLLEKGVAAKGKKIQLEKKEYLPKLGLGAFFDYGIAPGMRNDEDENAFTNPFNYTKGGAGFELTSELDFRKIKARVKEATADQLKVIAQKRAAFRGLEVDLKKTYLELKQYNNLVLRAEKEMRAARQIVFLTKSNLDIGLGEKKDYLDALQSYLVFQGRHYEAIFYFNTSVAQLKQKIGTLYPEQGAGIALKKDDYDKDE